MDWLKKAPTSITITVICVCGVLALGVVAAYTVLTLNGQDTAEFRQWVQTLGQLLVFPLLGTSAVASVAAARSSSAAEDNTNGNLTALQQEVRELREALGARRGRIDG
jgi:fructose-specific phosphotransferase system IIC component